RCDPFGRYRRVFSRSQWLMANSQPWLAAQTPPRGQHANLAAPQHSPRCQPAVGIVEIHVAADVENPPHPRPPSRVIEPGATVQKWYSPHPVGMIVKHQQIERLSLPAHQRQADVVKIARTAKSEHWRFIRLFSQVCRQSLLK